MLSPLVLFRYLRKQPFLEKLATHRHCAYFDLFTEGYFLQPRFSHAVLLQKFITMTTLARALNIYDVPNFGQAIAVRRWPEDFP